LIQNHMLDQTKKQKYEQQIEIKHNE